MSRIAQITYQTVSSLCHELMAIGENPTVRKIQSRIGGSYSTILTFHRQWREEQNLTNKLNHALSESFQQAVLVEIGHATATLKQKFLEQLTAEKDQIKEIQDLLAECEAKNEQISQDFEVYKKNAEQSQLALEKEIASASALVEESHKRESALKASLDAMRDKVHEADVKAAVLDTRCQELEKQNRRLEKEIEEIKGTTKSNKSG